MQFEQHQPWPRGRATIALVLLGALALGCGLATINAGYVDFGDGNYLYIAWRMSQGAQLYSEILSPQPPLHLHLGAALVWVGDRIGSAVHTVRVTLVIITLLTGWLIYRLARRWEFGRATSVLAVLIWALCPIGYRWRLGWQSENIEIPLLLTAQILLMRGGWRSQLLSGIAAAGALLCNMTAAPYVLFNGLFALVAFRRAGLLYWAGLIGGWGCVAALFEARTGAFFQNVILNQVSTYPGDTLAEKIAYSWGKLRREGASVLHVEGLFVGLAVGGMLAAGLRGWRRWRNPVAVYRGIYSLGGLLSITYVTKGGTVDYIFCLGEPYVGLWAAWCLVGLSRPVRSTCDDSDGCPACEGARFPRWAVAALIFALGAYQVAPYLWRYASQEGYEWPEDRMALVVDQIEAHSDPGDTILAPPYFAFITQRPLIEDFSSTYLWFTKWRVEMESGEPADGVAMMNRIAEAIREGRVALCVINGFSPAIVEATSNGALVSEDAWGTEEFYIAAIRPIRRAVLGSCRRVGPMLSSNLVHHVSDAIPGFVRHQEDLTFWVPRGGERDD